jgi:acetyl-CoA carboxylase biotin carboxylase subunit
VNAEDPAQDFMPSHGEVEHFLAPGGPGVRCDSHLYSGYTPPRNYDSLLAKVVTWGSDRDEALDRMRRALRETVVDGVKTTMPFQLAMIDDPAFRTGEISTRYVPELLERWKRAQADEI